MPLNHRHRWVSLDTQIRKPCCTKRTPLGLTCLLFDPTWARHLGWNSPSALLSYQNCPLLHLYSEGRKGRCNTHLPLHLLLQVRVLQTQAVSRSTVQPNGSPRAIPLARSFPNSLALGCCTLQPAQSHPASPSCSISSTTTGRTEKPLTPASSSLLSHSAGTKRKKGRDGRVETAGTWSTCKVLRKRKDCQGMPAVRFWSDVLNPLWQNGSWKSPNTFPLSLIKLVYWGHQWQTLYN